MKYIAMQPIERKPCIEIVHEDRLYDLHNTADFIGYAHDDAARKVTLKWDFGCDCPDITHGPIALVFDGVSNLTIQDKDPTVPRSEDLCLEEMREVSDATLCFLFRGGQAIMITCESVTFDPGHTRAHGLKT